VINGETRSTGLDDSSRRAGCTSQSPTKCTTLQPCEILQLAGGPVAAYAPLATAGPSGGPFYTVCGVRRSVRVVDAWEAVAQIDGATLEAVLASVWQRPAWHERAACRGVGV
jgi:hypothetical protein